MIPLIAVIAVGLFTMSSNPEPMYTVQEVAEWSKCDPANVAYYIGTIPYQEQEDWLPADVCLRFEQGDCKCFAQIAKEVLDRCVGFQSDIAILTSPRPSCHAITLFTDHKGRKGYVNGSSYGYLDSWEDVRDISGGPWEIREWKKK